MTFLLDQDVPDAIGRVAAQEGHTVTRLREVLPPDADDPTIQKFALSQQSVLACLALLTSESGDFGGGS